MRICLLAFCLGVGMASRLSSVTVAQAVCCAVLAGMCLSGCVYWRLRRPVDRRGDERCGRPASRLAMCGARYQAAWYSALRMLTGLSLGLAWTMWVAVRLQAAQLPTQLEGVDFWVEGVVTSLVQQWDRSQRFEMLVHGNCFRLLPDACEDQPDVLVGHRIQLNDYGALPLATGDYWRLRVRLTRPYGLSNPGTRDTQARLRQQGIVARGYVRETPLNSGPMEAARQSLTSRIQQARAHIAATLDGFVHLPQRGVLKALVIGDYSGLGAAQWEIFNITGTSHLMVISGMHIGFVALLAYTVVNVLSRASVALISRIAAQRLAAYVALAAAVGYALLAGFSLPAQRALIMLSVLMAGRIVGRRLLPSYSLSLAATLVLIRDPLAITQPGFWLSFTAVASLLLGFVGYLPAARAASHTGRAGPQLIGWARNGWQRWVAPQWVVSCGLLLPLLLWTGQVSLISPLTNIVAIPVVSLVVVPTALLGTLMTVLSASSDAFTWLAAAGTWLLWLADKVLQLMMPALAWAAGGGTEEAVGVAPVVWQPAPPTPLAAMLLGLASLILLLPRGLVPRWYALLLILPVLWPAPAPRPKQGELWAHFLDVGQGLAVVLQTRRHALLFDTGPSYSEDADAASSVIVPFLRQQRTGPLSMVIVSHWHDDHSGGLRSVVRQWPVRAVIAGRWPDQPLALPSSARTAPDLQPIAPGLCRADWSWVWDAVTFTMLHPDGQRHSRENDYSCVLRVDAGGQSLLLTGDIEAAAERLLLARRGEALRADVLQAAHHGSRTSTTEPFLDAVRPQLVIVPAAYHNRFGHPATEVTARFIERDIPFLQTGRSGAVRVHLGGAHTVNGGGSPQVVSEHRHHARRWWHQLPP